MVRSLIQQEKYIVLFLQETKSFTFDFEFFRNKFWPCCAFFTHGSKRNSGQHSILWNKYRLDYYLNYKNNSWMVILTKHLDSSLQFILINIQGPQNSTQKIDYWNQLFAWFLQHDDLPYILHKDLNAIKNLSEKQGGIHRLKRCKEDFNNFIHSNKLFEPFYTKGNFTWSNEQSKDFKVLKKLDKFLFSSHWLSQGHTMQTKILPIGGSNHQSILFMIDIQRKCTGSPFIF